MWVHASSLIARLTTPFCVQVGHAIVCPMQSASSKALQLSANSESNALHPKCRSMPSRRAWSRDGSLPSDGALPSVGSSHAWKQTVHETFSQPSRRQKTKFMCSALLRVSK